MPNITTNHAITCTNNAATDIIFADDTNVFVSRKDKDCLTNIHYGLELAGFH